MNLPENFTERAAKGDTAAVDPTAVDTAALVLVGIALFAVLYLGLLAALLAGLLSYQCANLLAMRHQKVGVTRQGGKAIALGLMAGLVIVLLSLGTVSVADLLTGNSESVEALMRKMADAIGTARTHFPARIQPYLPANVDEMESAAADWLRQHAGALGNIGESFGKLLIYIVIGMIIGGMIVLANPSDGYAHGRPPGPLARALQARAMLLGRAFRRVVFGQIRISAINTLLTALYLAAILPLFGVHLPLVKTMIAVTFAAGLLPVLGNLISNTVIVVVSLSLSFYVAIASLVFLVAVHKLEYFINARIIGGQIRARAWELLLAMLVMEAAFGIPGIIAAPIYYAYLKSELSARGLI